MSSETESGMQTVPARVLVADDHELVRDGFKRVLGYERDLAVVGEATNGREAVELCGDLKPDLVLMDVRMPQMDGLEATRQIKVDHPEISVLVITTYENPEYLLEAIKAGAAGYVLKDAPNQQLLSAMRRALEGESPINQELATQLIQRLAGEASQPAAAGSQAPSEAHESAASEAPPSLLEELTPREEEVLGLVAQGKTNQEIARSLSISRATAKVHVRHIIAKLGVSDRTQAVVRALELGLAPYPKKTGP
jgi:DNA-binding NarL/FixJ family response regulator